MKIQSTFKDYYDGAASSGIDTSIVYKRDTSLIQLDDGFFIDNLPQHFPDDLGEENYFGGRSLPNREYCKWMIIGFCGQYHLTVVNTLPDNVHKHTMAYYGEEILELEWHKVKSIWRREDPRIVIKQMIQQWHLRSESKYFAQLNTPIFAKEIQQGLSKYEWKNKQLYLEKFEVNPNLNNYKFFKVYDAFTAFQSIQSYISGILGTKENDIVEVSNKSKILKAGFDLKTSFRNDKKK
jgi:hypothetical protein